MVSAKGRVLHYYYVLPQQASIGWLRENEMYLFFTSGEGKKKRKETPAKKRPLLHSSAAQGQAMDERGPKRARQQRPGGGIVGGLPEDESYGAYPRTSLVGCHLRVDTSQKHLFIGIPIEVKVSLLNDEDMVQHVTQGINVSITGEDGKVSWVLNRSAHRNPARGSWKFVSILAFFWTGSVVPSPLLEPLFTARRSVLVFVGLPPPRRGGLFAPLASRGRGKVWAGVAGVRKKM